LAGVGGVLGNGTAVGIEDCAKTGTVNPLKPRLRTAAKIHFMDATYPLEPAAKHDWAYCTVEILPNMQYASRRA
jgi:hypothetical protein